MLRAELLFSELLVRGICILFNAIGVKDQMDIRRCIGSSVVIWFVYVSWDILEKNT
jgi:hypothetical protein